jgi:hypothetical protein
MIKVVLPPDILALALYTAENRPKHVAVPQKSVDPDADVVGALPEHAWAWMYHMPQALIAYESPYGDGGVDFTMEEGTVDIKASQRHPTSWTIKMGPLRSLWYVFCHVILPDTVWFVAKAHKGVLTPIKESQIVPGVRLVNWPETPGMTEFRRSDFRPIPDGWGPPI